MPVIPLDPYVADVAMTLSIAGHHVTETWTEPVEPADHCIEWATTDGGTANLVWDGTGWRWFYYPPTGTRAVYPLTFEGPTTDRLLDGQTRPTADDVIAAVHATFNSEELTR